MARFSLEEEEEEMAGGGRKKRSGGAEEIDQRSPKKGKKLKTKGKKEMGNEVEGEEEAEVAAVEEEGGEGGEVEEDEEEDKEAEQGDGGISSGKENGDGISVRIDPDVLDCSICYEPLRPPLFQSTSGCRETIPCNQKDTHEESCPFAPCSCPILGCTFRGTTALLSGHIRDEHCSTTPEISFSYDRYFKVALQRKELFFVLHGKDDRIFLLLNECNYVPDGNSLSIACTRPGSMESDLGYTIMVKGKGSELHLKSSPKNIRELKVASDAESFLFVPRALNDSAGVIYIDVVIRKMDDDDDDDEQSGLRFEAKVWFTKLDSAKFFTSALKAVHITPSMAHQLIQILRSESIEFIVAPYEADAQLAYFSALDDDQGGIAAVITEDSDLIAYGCKAVIFKMDRYGNGEEFFMDRVFNTVRGGLSFRNFDKELFTGMCVLAGCDFLPSIPGIGTKRAYSLVSKYKNLDRVMSTLKFDRRYQMPENYSDCFWKTVAVFHHARIYDRETKSLKPMKPLEQKHLQSLNGDLDPLGPYPTPAFDHIDQDETQMASTQESCITIFSANQANEEYVTVPEEIAVDPKKYVKEALALGKLIAPLECHQVAEHEVDRRTVPDNNPFKKRKLESGKSEGRESHMTEPVSGLTDERSVMLCSSHESQESAESKPKKRILVRKDKIQKSNTSDSKSLNSEKNGVTMVDVNRKQSRVTVTGHVEPKKVLNKVKSTGKRVEFWPYVPYNLVYHPYAAQAYDKRAPSGYVRNVVQAGPSPGAPEEQLISLFSDDNPNACSIM
ncbi:putative exonuclease 1 [Cocos nucifera]|uniref:Exonuclease 1 n=1 Tax=Cocos nucifera TaxID=13894 RepID=A0A8K0MYW1_COCNU|nr:putative exonuclease 1 [Cocos nucifera]